MSKKTGLRFTLAAFFVLFLILLPISLGAANYTGFCFSKKKFLSKQEKIEIVADYVNKISDRVGIKPYSDVHTLLKENPDCCVTGVEAVENKSWPDSQGWVRPTFKKKLFGQYADIVGITIQRKYADQKGEEKSKQLQAAYVIGNCGQMGDDLIQVD